MQAQYNKAVNDWGKATASKLIFAVAKLNLRDRVRKDGAKSLKESIKHSVKKNSGDAEAIIFRYNYYGYFLDKGLGRETTNNDRFHRDRNKITGGRQAQPWLGITIEPNMNSLAATIADIAGNEYLQSIKVLGTKLDDHVPGAGIISPK